MIDLINYNANESPKDYFIKGAKYIITETNGGNSYFPGFIFTVFNISSIRLEIKLTKENLQFIRNSFAFVVGDTRNLLGFYYTIKPLSVIHFEDTPYHSSCGIDPRFSTTNINLVTCKNCLKTSKVKNLNEI